MPNGQLDPTFAPPFGANDSIYSMTLQPDNKILIGGPFTQYDRARRMGLARLRPDSSLDTSFMDTALNQFAGFTHPTHYAYSNPNYVNSIAVQPDGHIIVGGSFTNVNGVPRNGIARLNSDGSLDGTFDPGTGVMIGFDGEEPTPGFVNTLALITGGRIAIGGRFSAVNGAARNGLACLTAAGTLDATFAQGQGLANESGDEAFVSALAVQPDGRILVAGCFTHADGVPRTIPDGSSDNL